MFRINPFSDPLFDYHTRPIRMFDPYFDEFFDDSRFYNPIYPKIEEQQMEVEGEKNLDPEYEKQLIEYEKEKKRLEEQERRLQELYLKKQRHNLQQFEKDIMKMPFEDEFFQNQLDFLKNPRDYSKISQNKKKIHDEDKGKQRLTYVNKSESMRQYINEKGERVVISKFAEDNNGEKSRRITEQIYDKDNKLISDQTFKTDKEIEDFEKKQIEAKKNEEMSQQQKEKMIK